VSFIGFSGAATGANPTDRGKRGVKRSLLTDGTGIPLALVIEGANRHDMKLLYATVDGLVIARPEPTQSQPQHLCLDAGYDYPAIREQVEAHDYLPHMRGRGQEKQEKIATPGFRARRWVVERTHSWLNRSRRLLVAPWRRRSSIIWLFSIWLVLSSCLPKVSLGNEFVFLLPLLPAEATLRSRNDL